MVSEYGLLSTVMAEKDDSAFLDMIDPREGPMSRKYFGLILALETENQINRDPLRQSQRGLDAVMGRLDDLKGDDDHGSGVRERAQEMWDYIFDMIKGIRQQRALEGELTPLKFPPGIDVDPVPDLYKRVKAAPDDYAEFMYRATRSMKTGDIPGEAQIRADVTLLEKLKTASSDIFDPYYSLARHHTDEIGMIGQLTDLRITKLARKHREDQMTGTEAGASPKLNEVRRTFVERFARESGIENPRPEDLWPDKIHDDGSMLSEKEASTLRDADRIKTRLKRRLEEERGVNQKGEPKLSL